MSEERQEIEPFEFEDIFKSNTALMVTMGKDNELNVMALDWKKLYKDSFNSEPEEIPVIRAQVAYSRYTYKLLTEGVEEFTVNIPSKTQRSAVSIAGYESGRNTNKFKKANLEIIPGKKTKVPTIKGSQLSYECAIIHEEKSPMSSHHYFYGKILKSYAASNI